LKNMTVTAIRSGVELNRLSVTQHGFRSIYRKKLVRGPHMDTSGARDKIRGLAG